MELEFYQTQYALLKARSLAERVARSANLTNNAVFLDAFGLDGDLFDVWIDTGKKRVIEAIPYRLARWVEQQQPRATSGLAHERGEGRGEVVLGPVRTLHQREDLGVRPRQLGRPPLAQRSNAQAQLARAH